MRRKGRHHLRKVAGPIAEELNVSIFARHRRRRQGPPLNKDHLRAAGPPHHEVRAGDGTDWQNFEDVLQELGLSLRRFRTLCPHVGLEHRGLHGQVIIDVNQLEEGGR
jgi:hypothetical protein